MEEKKEAVIYGVKTEDTIHYIGKKIDGVNAEGNINKSSISYGYNNPKLRNVFVQNENAVIVPLKIVPQEGWYDEKLLEVVAKHKDNHPLLNAQWMLDGKRGFWEGTGGFWEGKKRDAHTLQRLSESKFKKVVQYDSNGCLVKVWNSGKEVGEKVFGDYKVVKGAGETKLYDVWNATTLKGRFRFNSYWFKEQEMRNYFGLIPTKLNIAVLYAEERKRKQRIIVPKCKRCGDDNPLNFYPHNKTHCKKCLSVLYKKVSKGQKRSTIIWYNQDGSIKETFQNTYEAAYKLKTSVAVIQRLCRGEKENDDYILRYGEKIIQPHDINYPDYKIEPLRKQRRVVKVYNPEDRAKTRTRSVVEQYDRGKLVHVFADVHEAAKELGIDEATIRRICRTGTRPKDNLPKGTYLKLGQKRQVVINQPIVKDIQIDFEHLDIIDDIPL